MLNTLDSLILGYVSNVPIPEFMPLLPRTKQMNKDKYIVILSSILSNTRLLSCVWFWWSLILSLTQFKVFIMWWDISVVLFLHQSESKEIDEMKRIAVVVMRKDRELKNLKKIIYIVLLTDNNQNEMGPTIWLRLFPKRAFWILYIMHAFAIQIFCKIKC